jgi:C-terminal processing protease CtpA/Prc/Tol biopolymer transport system component
MLKLKSRLIASAILLFSLSAFAESPFVRYPSLNSDGTKIAFSYQGDIWICSSSGENAVRLTIHEAYEGYPQWSGDDSRIGFSSNRFGNYDVFTIPSDGGVPERLTYHSSTDYINDFTNDGNILFTTARVFRQVEWDREIYGLSSSGGTPDRKLNAVGDMPVMSDDGRFIAFVRGWGRWTREDYRGPANLEIWNYDTQNDTYIKLTEFEGNDFYPRWDGSRTIYFISARSGNYNIHRLTIDEKGNKSGAVEQVTSFSGDGVRYFNISGDGAKLAMERQTDIYLMNTAGGTPEKVNVRISADYRLDPFEHKTYTNRMSEYSVSPSGKYTAFVVRGEIFVTENDKEKKKAKNLTNHPYRDHQVDWLNDTTLVYSSDKEGNYDLYLLRSADSDETDIFKSFKHESIKITDREEDESWPVVSPDGKKIAYEIGKGKLVVSDISADGDLSNETVLLDGWSAPGDVTWSPDGKWLAYSLSDLDFNDDIFIHAADNSREPVNVSMHPKGDYNPVWSPDGKKLGFLSSRNNNDMDVWFAWLTKEDWEKTKLDWEEADEEDNEKEKEEDKDSAKVKEIKIDFEDIYQRLEQVTRLSGDESNPAISKDGETFYFVTSSPTEKGSDLFSVKWDGTEIKALTKGGTNPSSVKLDKDGKYLYYSKRGSLSRYNLSGDKSESLPFSAKMKIVYEKEREQIFEEAWRALDQNFYDPDFHGKSWNSLKDKYKPWCLKASTHKDFQDMFNLMLGELNASHMALRGGDDRIDTQEESTGRLGIEVESAGDGVLVTHVVMNSPADKEKSKIEVGEKIISVNGSEINDNMNFYSLLTNTANENVLLEVESVNNDTREVIIRPASSLGSELYEEWVESKKNLVDEYSNGRLGYLHIEGMSIPSFERFVRELTARGYKKEGIVIDVRYNGGGWTTDYLMTVLNYKQHAYTVPRGATDDLETNHPNFKTNYPLGERLPYAAWTKPSIALCNQNSYSNAEIFSHAYKTLGIGKLVGVPTFGAVISTWARGLMDGSYVRLPGRGWYVLATGENMENGPAVPDIIVYNSPDSKAKNKDEQLRRAVDELLSDIDANK